LAKWREDRPHFIAESSMHRRELEEFLPKKRAGRSEPDFREESGHSRLQEEPDAGIAEGRSRKVPPFPVAAIARCDALGPPGPSFAMEWRGIFELHCQRDYASGAIQVGDKMVASSDEDLFRIPYTVRTARLISSPLSARTA
jgi:hypothetical protein